MRLVLSFKMILCFCILFAIDSTAEIQNFEKNTQNNCIETNNENLHTSGKLIISENQNIILSESGEINIKQILAELLMLENKKTHLQVDLQKIINISHKDKDELQLLFDDLELLKTRLERFSKDGNLNKVIEDKDKELRLKFKQARNNLDYMSSKTIELESNIAEIDQLRAKLASALKEIEKKKASLEDQPFLWGQAYDLKGLFCMNN